MHLLQQGQGVVTRKKKNEERVLVKRSPTGGEWIRYVLTGTRVCWQEIEGVAFLQKPPHQIHPGPTGEILMNRQNSLCEVREISQSVRIGNCSPPWGTHTQNVSPQVCTGELSTFGALPTCTAGWTWSDHSCVYFESYLQSRSTKLVASWYPFLVLLSSLAHILGYFCTVTEQPTNFHPIAFANR